MRKGFTLVELLTVIAIIAVLAAIIFPVFNRVRENARRTSCTSNLQNIYVAFEQYKLDHNGAYPPALFGYADCTNPQAMDNVAAAGFLKPYLKSADAFKCPNNPATSKTQITRALYPVNHGASRVFTDRLVRDLKAPNTPIVCFYTMDSYDIGRMPDGSYELRYTLFWSHSQIVPGLAAGYFDDPIGAKQGDTTRQLGYRDPESSTVVTWCSYHRAYSGNTPTRSKDDLVLFADGRVMPRISSEVFASPYLTKP